MWTSPPLTPCAGNAYRVSVMICGEAPTTKSSVGVAMVVSACASVIEATRRINPNAKINGTADGHRHHPWDR